jgi:hypothetical protein
MIDTRTVFCRASDVRFRKLDEEGLVLSQKRAEVIGLNGVGARVVELCDGARTFESIVDQLEEEYEIDRPTLESDTSEFVDEMLELGILVRTD